MKKLIHCLALIVLLSLSTGALADAGVPAQMLPGSSVVVTMKLRNTGVNSWCSTGNSPVRFVLRWIDAQNHVRYGWSVKWLKGTVKPGESTLFSFALTAPLRSANYQLSCGLVRLNAANYDGKSYRPPASDAPDQRWSGEFSTVTYNVNVTP